MAKNIGLTKDAGWQFGIRKTMPTNVETLWETFFFSDRGLGYWAEGVDQNFRLLKNIHTSELHGSIKILKKGPICRSGLFQLKIRIRPQFRFMLII